MSKIRSRGAAPDVAIQNRGEISISAKNLGDVAKPDFCPRCFWIKLRLKNDLPFQKFPGIFASIDSYNKHIVHGWFDKYQNAPHWMQKLGPLKNYVNPPSYQRYKFFDSEHGIWLCGSPDGVLVRPDNSYVIIDYKTAKYTEVQDSLYPIYEVQLNVYALLGMKTGMFPVITGLALIYMEPLSDPKYAHDDTNHTNDGFSMGFAANIHHVGLNVDMIPGLLGKVREIHDMEIPPDVRDGCEDCENMDKLIGLVSATRQI